jgi:hypothetical protein
MALLKYLSSFGFFPQFWYVVPRKIWQYWSKRCHYRSSVFKSVLHWRCRRVDTLSPIFLFWQTNSIGGPGTRIETLQFGSCGLGINCWPKATIGCPVRAVRDVHGDVAFLRNAPSMILQRSRFCFDPSNAHIVVMPEGRAPAVLGFLFAFADIKLLYPGANPTA